jgi:hypothetical protein
MVQVRVNTNIGAVSAALDQYRVDLRERAAVSAVNKTMDKANTRMRRVIIREFNVSAGYVRERLRVERAKFVGGKAVIAAALTGSGSRGAKRSANLIAFVVSKVSLAQARKRMAAGEGGTYQLGGTTRTKALELQFKIKRGGAPKIIPGAFIANKGRTVFIREGKSRLPIKALSTIDIPQMFTTRRLNDGVVKAIEQEFPSIFEHEVKFYTDRFNRRRA